MEEKRKMMLYVINGVHFHCVQSFMSSTDVVRDWFHNNKFTASNPSSLIDKRLVCHDKSPSQHHALVLSSFHLQYPTCRHCLLPHLVPIRQVRSTAVQMFRIVWHICGIRNVRGAISPVIGYCCLSIVISGSYAQQ